MAIHPCCSQNRPLRKVLFTKSPVQKKVAIFDPLKMDGRADGNQKKAFPYGVDRVLRALVVILLHFILIRSVSCAKEMRWQTSQENKPLQSRFFSSSALSTVTQGASATVRSCRHSGAIHASRGEVVACVTHTKECLLTCAIWFLPR